MLLLAQGSFTAPPPPTRCSLILTGALRKDITTANKDEIISDTFKLIDVGDGLWEVDCRMINKGGDNFGMCHQMRLDYLSMRAVDFFQQNTNLTFTSPRRCQPVCRRGR